MPALDQNPWNISPRDRQTPLQFWNFDFFLTICGAPPPQLGGISATSLVRFVEPQTANTRCKFYASSSYDSEDTGRQSWSQKIWAKNEAEKNKSEKREWLQKSQYKTEVAKLWHDNRGA